MTFSPANSVAPFLQTSDYFPDEFDEFRVNFLALYRNISNNVNIRQIGVYDKVEFLTGQQWFDPNNAQLKRQAFRKVFTFTAVGNITHNISNLTQVNAYGEYTDGTNFYGAIYASNVAIAGQVTFFVTPTVITVQAGAGAPAIVNGVIVLEFLKS